MNLYFCCCLEARVFITLKCKPKFMAHSLTMCSKNGLFSKSLLIQVRSSSWLKIKSIVGTFSYSIIIFYSWLLWLALESFQQSPDIQQRFMKNHKISLFLYIHKVSLQILSRFFNTNTNEFFIPMASDKFFLDIRYCGYTQRLI